MYLQGGEEGKVTANIKLSNDTQNTSSDADASVKGWKVWQNPNTEDVKAAIGDTLTVTITVNGKATSWGSVDDIYLYLKQADPVYQVTYHLDSGVNAETNPVKFDGTKTIALADPSREGYSFKGWYTDSEFKNAFAGITSETKGNLTIYAKWEEEGNSDNKDVKVTEIKLDASTKKILRGKSFTLKVTDVLPKDATEKAVI